jgi:hypothetical protein
MFSKPQIPAAGAAGAVVSRGTGRQSAYAQVCAGALSTVASTSVESWRESSPSVHPRLDLSKKFPSVEELLERAFDLCLGSFHNICELIPIPKNGDIVRHLPFHAHKYLYSLFELKDGNFCLCGVPIYPGVLPFLHRYLEECKKNKNVPTENPQFRFVFFLNKVTWRQMVTMFCYADPKEADDIEVVERVFGSLQF